MGSLKIQMMSRASIDSQAVPPTAPFTYQRRESLGASEALLTDFSPEVADFGVAPGGGVNRFTNR